MFMFSIDKLRPYTQLGDHIYDSTASYIDQSYRFGVANSFRQSPHFKTLSVNLKNKLTFEVLKQYYDKLYFFFNDIVERNFADQNFVRKVLVSLDCVIYYPG